MSNPFSISILEENSVTWDAGIFHLNTLCTSLFYFTAVNVQDQEDKWSWLLASPLHQTLTLYKHYLSYSSVQRLWSVIFTDWLKAFS